MIRKISIIGIMIIMFSNMICFAGDIPESIMLGNQKALFLGQIVDVKEDKCSIKPTTIMMGNIESSNIKVNKFDKYYGNDDKVKIGDYVVAILLDDENIDKDWIFKTSNDDYKHLKLLSTNHDMVSRYQDYINKGEYFKAQEKLDKDEGKNIISNKNSDNKVDYETSVYKNIFLIGTIIAIVLIGVILSRFKYKK